MSGHHEERRAARRNAILTVLAEVVTARGTTVSVDELARALQRTKPVLYKHFLNRSGIFVALVDWSAQARAEWLATAVTPCWTPEALLSPATSSEVVWPCVWSRLQGMAPENANVAGALERRQDEHRELLAQVLRHAPVSIDAEAVLLIDDGLLARHGRPHTVVTPSDVAHALALVVPRTTG
jgi:AcrR family transcriptional regulator